MFHFFSKADEITRGNSNMEHRSYKERKKYEINNNTNDYD
jgi:hypothetical protein